MPVRTLLFVACLLGSTCPGLATQELPHFGYEVARQHELKPHRRTIPLDGVTQGFNQFHITLTVSQAGDVLEADTDQSKELMKFWPTVKPEVLQWKFIPFEQNGKAVIAELEEYIDLVPPERLPRKHVAPPPLRADSRITITLVRTVCYGTCPSYSVMVSNDEIVFEGQSFVAAGGKHTDTANPEEVQALAQKFIAADFYSMEPRYHASVTDNPTYVLAIEIDGQKKEVVDYVGREVGMPGVITELEDAVDSFARTERWIKGSRSR
jgi:hypothetical protein